MAASPAFSWSEILDQADDKAPRIGERISAEVLRLKPDYSQTVTTLGMSADIPGNVADWTTVLDIVNGMGGTAGDLRQRLKEQAGQYENNMKDLRRDLNQIQQHVRAVEAQAEEAKMQSEIRLEEIQTQADARVEQIRADADARLQRLLAVSEAKLKQAEARLQSAETRAATAERWLGRISEAAKRQLLSA